MRSEAVVQQQTVLAGAYGSSLLWRNNVGACQDETGRLIRYGLCNDSKKQNDEMKSSDLIGITRVTAFMQSVGWCTLGVFTAFECKPEGWHQVPSDKRAIAQARYHDIVRQNGGFAGFVTDPLDIAKLVRLT